METFASSFSSPTPKNTATRLHQIQPTEVISRLNQIYQLSQSPRVLKIVKAYEKEGEAALDEINNVLMGIFRDHRLVEAYSMLYELNYKRFMLIIFNKVKYYSHLLDPRDILQDVFLSVYRYPKRFREGKPHAFRNWTYSIIRNTIFKHLKIRGTHETTSETMLDIVEDKKGKSPLIQLVNREGIKRFKELYILYLILYLNVFNNFLAERERLALHLVEVDDKRYREASDILGIKLENFKMVVCRARKKILKRMCLLLGEDQP